MLNFWLEVLIFVIEINMPLEADYITHDMWGGGEWAGRVGPPRDHNLCITYRILDGFHAHPLLHLLLLLPFPLRFEQCSVWCPSYVRFLRQGGVKESEEPRIDTGTVKTRVKNKNGTIISVNRSGLDLKWIKFAIRFI